MSLKKAFLPLMCSCSMYGLPVNTKPGILKMPFRPTGLRINSLLTVFNMWIKTSQYISIVLLEEEVLLPPIGCGRMVSKCGGTHRRYQRLENASKPLEGKSNETQLTVEQYWASIPKDKTTLVDFGATWCPPCVKMNPVLDELQNNKELNFLLVKVDAGIHTDVMKALNVEPIPVFIVYKEGKEVWRKQGVVSKEELLTQLK